MKSYYKYIFFLKSDEAMSIRFLQSPTNIGAHCQKYFQPKILIKTNAMEDNVSNPFKTGGVLGG